MALKRKTTEEVVEMLLREKCIASIKNWECISSDNVKYCLQDPEYFERYYEEWLIRHRFAEKIN